MNEMNHDMLEDDPGCETEALIASVAANEAGRQEWRRFEAVAASEPAAWERLARTLRDELQVRTALEREVACAETIEPPMHLAGEHHALARLRAWPGWALAAVLALAWAVSFLESRQEASSQEANIANRFLPARNSADDAYTDYLTLGAQEGRVLQELPMMMIETHFDAGAGKVEVVYVRQLLERATVDSAIQLREDEFGRVAPVPVNIQLLRNPDPL